MSLMSWSSKTEDMAQQSKFQFMQGTAKQNSRSALTACTPCLAQAPAGSGPGTPSICLTPLCCRHRDWCVHLRSGTYLSSILSWGGSVNLATGLCSLL